MASAASVLPPVTEALSLLDVSFVNNEWHGTPATIRRSIQILVDHISVQNVQLSRVEDILTAFGSPSHQGGTVWNKLAGKADLSRLERLEAQVDGLLNDCAQLRTQQSAASNARDETVSRLELLRDQMGSMEARLGLPYTPDSAATGIDQYSGSRRPVTGPYLGSYTSPSKRAAVTGSLVPSVPTGSLLDRISRLERRTDTLAETSAKAEDESSLLVAKLREMEPRLEVQIGHLRGDIKQALALAAASTRLEADAESTSRIKEAEKRLLSRIQSVGSTLEGKVSAVSAQTGITISGELDKRVNTLYDHIDVQVQRLCGDLDRLSRDKVDLSALEHYSQRISSLFEGVAQGLADEVAALVAQLRAEVANVARDVDDSRLKDKVLHDNYKAEMDGMRQLSSQVKEAVSVVQDTLSTTHTPRLLEDTRAIVRQVMTDAEQLQKAVTGLNTAMSSTSNALELQSHKLGQLSHRLNGLQHDVIAVKDTLYGGAGASCDLDGANGTSSPASASLLSKLTSLDRTIADVTASLSSKAEDSLTRDMERRLAAMVRQQDVTAEGLRNLSATAFKRADEHASAIQRLTLAVSGNLEERPTTTAVKHLIETAGLEVRERCDNALAPIWDAVRILQSGLRDAAGELKAFGSNVGSLQQAQNDSRSKVTADRTSIMAALRKALDEEMGSLRTQLEARLDSMEGGVRQVIEELQLHAKLQDQLTRLTTAVEEQLATQVAAWRAGNQQLRCELNSRAEAATAGLAARVEVVEGTCRRHSEEMQAIAETSSAKPCEAVVRDMVNTCSRTVAKQEISRHEQNWQVWLEEHSRSHESLTTHSNLSSALDNVSRQIKQELDSAAATRIDELRRAFSSLRGELDGRMRATTSRVEVAELRVQDLEVVVATCVSKKDVGDIAATLACQRADRTDLDAKIRELAEELVEQTSALKVFRSEAVTRSEMTAELARKVDLATYLAQGSARAAAASAGALVGTSLSTLSPLCRGTHDRPADFVARLGTGAGTGALAVARAAERLQLGNVL